MLFHIIQYEWKMMLRQPAYQALTGIFLLLTILSMFQGKLYFHNAQEHIDKLIQEEKQQRKQAIAHLKAIENGSQAAPEERNPQIPYELGGRQITSYVAKTHSPLAPLSIGHSELFGYAYPVSITNSQLFAPMMDHDNLAHPLQHLFSWIDPAFVLIWLLPFWVIITTYNIRSQEKEEGTLALIRSQPIFLSSLLSTKLLIRCVLIMGLVFSFLLISMITSGIPFWKEPKSIIQISILICGHITFWSVLAFFVNTFKQSSAVNAGLLFACWLAFVVVIPSSLQVAADRSFPLPSRMELVHEIRETELEISLKINEEMDGFYLDHPELAPKDDQQKMPYWHYQVAFQKRNALETFCPIIEKYYSQSKQKNLWLTHW